MDAPHPNPDPVASMFASPEWYDRTINWSARLGRELPVLMDVFGPPGPGGVLDAGCGTGRQAAALANQGYQVTGVDGSEEMLRFARDRAAAGGATVRFVHRKYEGLRGAGLGGFDGVYCIGNSLAAAGSAEGVAAAIGQFAAVLRPGGRMFVQILNFDPMRRIVPCVQGPRVAVVEGQEYISVRQFHFVETGGQGGSDANRLGDEDRTEDRVEVTNITLWNEGGWRQRSHTGHLYPVVLDELRDCCETAGLRIDHMWGSYGREPFDVDRSVDLIVVATRR